MTFKMVPIISILELKFCELQLFGKERQVIDAKAITTTKGQFSTVFTD